MQPFRRVSIAAALLCFAGCSTDAKPVTHSLFEVPVVGEPLAEGFYSLPYPNDLRLRDDGGIDLTGLARPNALLEDFIDAIDQTQRGFGLSAAIYFRFDGPIDVASLPQQATESQLENASVYLVNLDTDSANRGQKIPLEFRFQVRAGELIGDHWLSCLPYPGFILEEQTTYGLVVTSRLGAEGGGDLAPSDDFEAVMATSQSNARIARAQQLYKPLTRWLDEEGGDERIDVINAAVFTTQDATGLLGRARAVIEAEVLVPEVRELEKAKSLAAYEVYTGRYDSPHFQAGEYPYKNVAQGGDFELDGSGNPIVQSENDLRVGMSIPAGVAMPDAGWPVVLYAHGTGGDYLSFERDQTARRFAELGIAVISTDQVMHGDRLERGDPQNLFFNFQNPLSSRANVLQAAVEDFQLTRLAANIDVVDEARSIRFDDDKMYFFGHSQGSSTGIPFVAHEPRIKGAILSGAGGLLYLTLLTKKKPFDVMAILELVIRDHPLDQFSPALALLQAFYEPADVASYGPLLVKAPPAGMSPKNIFQLLGYDDGYTPVPSIKALATSAEFDLVDSGLEGIDGLELRGKATLSAPITNNAGSVTAVVSEYAALPGDDGHFVVFDVPEAALQATQFIKTLADTGKATVVAP